MLLKLCILSLSILLSFFPGAASAGVSCATGEGLEICVQARGPVDLYHLLPGETTEFPMDMFFVTVTNRSERRFRVDPAHFVAVTEKGQKVRLDVPFLESIQLRTKLRRTDLGPGERVEGHLFFPSHVGRLQAVAHQVRPFLQVRLY